MRTEVLERIKGAEKQFEDVAQRGGGPKRILAKMTILF